MAVVPDLCHSVVGLRLLYGTAGREGARCGKRRCLNAASEDDHQESGNTCRQQLAHGLPPKSRLVATCSMQNVGSGGAVPRVLPGKTVINTGGDRRTSERAGDRGAGGCLGLGAMGGA
jgi:hypothetical protein